MKDRLAYSPKDDKINVQFEMNFKKSPYKYTTYDSPTQSTFGSNRVIHPYVSNYKEFENLKKVP
jgi:hypothetical protein